MGRSSNTSTAPRPDIWKEFHENRAISFQLDEAAEMSFVRSSDELMNISVHPVAPIGSGEYPSTSLSDPIGHECGLALVRLKQPLHVIQERHGDAAWGLRRLHLLMEKQRNRGQDGAGIATIKLDMPRASRSSTDADNQTHAARILDATGTWEFSRQTLDSVKPNSRRPAISSARSSCKLQHAFRTWRIQLHHFFARTTPPVETWLSPAIST